MMTTDVHLHFVRQAMRRFTLLSLFIIAMTTGPAGCASDRADDDFVYFRTAPMTAAGADSVGALLLNQHLGVSHVAAVGPEIGTAPRNGVVSFEAGSASRATRDRVIAWLRQRPEVLTAGLHKEGVWASPNGARRD